MNMKSLLVFIVALLSVTNLNAQLLDGAIVDENRQLISEEDFVLESRKDGYMIFTLAVDREGNVTSATFDEGNINSTPIMIDVKRHLLALKFEKGTYYPQHHHVRIKMKLIKQVE